MVKTSDYLKLTLEVGGGSRGGRKDSGPGTSAVSKSGPKCGAPCPSKNGDPCDKSENCSIPAHLAWRNDRKAHLEWRKEQLEKELESVTNQLDKTKIGNKDKNRGG